MGIVDVSAGLQGLLRKTGVVAARADEKVDRAERSIGYGGVFLKVDNVKRKDILFDGKNNMDIGKSRCEKKLVVFGKGQNGFIRWLKRDRWLMSNVNFCFDNVEKHRPGIEICREKKNKGGN